MARRQRHKSARDGGCFDGIPKSDVVMFFDPTVEAAESRSVHATYGLVGCWFNGLGAPLDRATSCFNVAGRRRDEAAAARLSLAAPAMELLIGCVMTMNGNG